MPDDQEPEFETGATVEFALDDLRRLLPIDPEHLREQLPGLEPERHVTDWGRSERIEGIVDRTLYDFLYHYWHRVEVDGIENVPLQSGALLVANHSGVFPSDGTMIAKAIRERHERGRTLHLSTESSLAGLPGLGMLVTKLGAVAANPANLHRLLFDERQLVLLFPEGTSGVRKALGQRYRLRAFEGAPFVPVAIHARVPIIPVAVLGAEEALPRFGSLGPLRRLARAGGIRVGARGGGVPITGLPLPAKFRIRFLEPVDTDGLDPASSEDPGFVDGLQNDIRALIQENLLELVAQRRSVWLG